MKAFLMRLLSSGGPQTKKVAYLLVVVAALGLLGWDLRGSNRITAEWVAALTALLAAVTGGYVVGKKVAAAVAFAGGAVGSSADPGINRPEGTC